jgi:hypothetical protein
MDQVLRAFIRQLNRYYRKLAKEEKITAWRIGAVTFIQNFGSALNLNPHFHNMMPDGVFDQDGTFFKVRKPRQHEIEQLLYNMAEKTLKLLANKFAESDEVEFDHEYDRLLASSVNVGRAPKDIEFPELNGRLSANLEGFSLHAATRIHENDRAGRQRLLSYGARGPIAESRLSKLPGGRFRYEMRRPMGNGQTELYFKGPELIGRLAALIPTPRKNMIRFFGVFAPASRLRSKVVPGHDAPRSKRPACGSDLEPDPTQPQDPKVQALMEHYQKANDARRQPSRIDWATLLKRTFGIDLSTCSKCGGKRRVIATIKDGPAIKKVLEHLGLPSEPLPMAPARAPPQADFFEAA